MGVGLCMPGVRQPIDAFVRLGLATAVCAPHDGLGPTGGHEQSATGVSAAANGQDELA